MPPGSAGFDIRHDDLASAQTRALLALHLSGMHANSPPGSVYALDLSGLMTRDVTVWSAWMGDRIASVGALAEAGRGGVRRVSLETGTGPTFEPALKLYESRGFVTGARFGDHQDNGFNRFLRLDLG